MFSFFITVLCSIEFASAESDNNIPVPPHSIRRNIQNHSDEQIQDRSNWTNISYNGHCPSTKKHRYIHSHATLNLIAGSSKSNIEPLMDGYILEKEDLLSPHHTQHSSKEDSHVIAHL